MTILEQNPNPKRNRKVIVKIFVKVVAKNRAKEKDHRAKTYEAIVKGETMPEPGLPESFNVLMHELKGLGLDIRLEE